MLELYIHSLFMVKGKCIPELKKEEERKGEAGPVRGWGNRKYSDLVTLQPFLLTNGNTFLNAKSVMISLRDAMALLW